MFLEYRNLPDIRLTRTASLQWGFNRHIFDVPVNKFSHATFVSSYLVLVVTYSLTIFSGWLVDRVTLHSCNVFQQNIGSFALPSTYQHLQQSQSTMGHPILPSICGRLHARLHHYTSGQMHSTLCQLGNVRSIIYEVVYVYCRYYYMAGCLCSQCCD